MLSMTLLFNRLKRDYPEFRFEESTEFWWSAKTNTVHLSLGDEEAKSFSLHELSHAVLNHKGYGNDIDLIKMERDAWHYASTKLAVKYGITISDQLIQDNLDTYREWLHARSKCPACETTGIQTKNHTYRCLGCGFQWRTNDARVCSLRRYSLHTK